VFNLDILRDIHPNQPNLEPSPNRRNKFGIVPDEDFVDGPVRAVEPELFRNPVVDEGFPEYSSEAFDQRQHRLRLDPDQYLKKKRRFRFF